jgi:hypothetical protein
MNLHDCALIRDATTHRSSSYDRTGSILPLRVSVERVAAITPSC